MIEQKHVIDFFDKLAPDWDAQLIRSDEKIRRILDHAGVTEGSLVLDVACGTGVLIPDYLSRGVSFVTAVDISPEMIRIAKEKYRAFTDRVRFLCGDVETADVGTGFDAVVVYNAFPHFPDPERLIRHLAGLLKDGGILTIAHGASREVIDAHHNGAASLVSNGLMAAEDLARIFSSYLEVTTVISDDEMYQVAGKKVSAR